MPNPTADRLLLARLQPLVIVLAVLAFGLSLSPTAHATDGVLEINQTCAVQTGCFPGDTAAYPVTITTPGSYRLTSNLIIPNENTDGIQVDTSDVGIDLNNFAILGPLTCSGSPLACTPDASLGSGVKRDILRELRGISVKNGSITGMGAFGVLLGDQAEVTGLRVRWNGLGGIYAGSGSTVSRNTAFQNGLEGIRADIGSSFSENTAYQNGDHGILALGGATVSGNTAYQNGNNGIFAGNGSKVSGNTVYQNAADGIRAGLGSTVDGNTTYLNSGDGIETNSGSAVFHNTTRANLGFGLNLLSASAVFRDNVVTQNGGTVSGGFSRGAANYCDGVNAPSCP